MNLVIIPIYMLEQILKCWALGWRRYCWEKGNVVDALITLSLVIVQIFYLAIFAVPYWGKDDVSVGTDRPTPETDKGEEHGPVDCG